MGDKGRMGSGQEEMEKTVQHLHREKVGMAGNSGLTETTRTKGGQHKDVETVGVDVSTGQDKEQKGTRGQF